MYEITFLAVSMIIAIIVPWYVLVERKYLRSEKNG